MKVKDWTVGHPLAAKTSMEYTLMETSLACDFVQQGRVVISERLHGSIAALLNGVPHVALDNAFGKVHGVYEAWVRDVPFVRLAKDGAEAMRMALELLEKYGDDLPKVSLPNIVHD